MKTEIINCKNCGSSKFKKTPDDFFECRHCGALTVKFNKNQKLSGNEIKKVILDDVLPCDFNYKLRKVLFLSGLAIDRPRTIIENQIELMKLSESVSNGGK